MIAFDLHNVYLTVWLRWSDGPLYILHSLLGSSVTLLPKSFNTHSLSLSFLFPALSFFGLERSDPELYGKGPRQRSTPHHPRITIFSFFFLRQSKQSWFIFRCNNNDDSLLLHLSRVNDDGIHNVWWDTATPGREPLSHPKSRKWLHIREKTP